MTTLNSWAVVNTENDRLTIVEEEDTPKVKLPFPLFDYYDYTDQKKSPIDFKNPANINTDIVYNPETDSYEVIQKIGDQYYRYPTSMTQAEYIEYQRQKALQEYWGEKVEEVNEQQRNLIPPLKVGGEAFDLIFGGDEINIRPQGSAELSFGVNVSRYDNPALPERQRRVATFDFQQQIQLNMVGQIGDKLKLTISQNTEATFNFQNQVKIEYTGYEDEIIQKIEAGNVSLPLNTTLIQGSQSLFGIRTDLRFGRLTVQTILSQQKGKRQEINVTGGAQVQDYEVRVDNYEANKHYFLSYYFRESYDEAMETMPIVNSPINITKIEVWVTNRINRVEDTRNIIAFSDIGEERIENYEGGPLSYGNEYPSNSANNLYETLKENPDVRNFSNAVNYLSTVSGSPGPFAQSVHYEKVENARRLSEQDFNYNAQLGFISLKSPLNQDEVLGVAFQYTVNGRTFQVGEFSTDVPVEEGSKSALMLKLLKPTIINPKNKTWDLMMKNVYSIGAYQVSEADFTFDVWYNNPTTSVDINYLPYDGADDILLMQQLELDRLNLNQELYADGRFDFVPIRYEGNRAINGGTVDPRTGRIYFTTIEPFGLTLAKKLDETTPLAPFEIDGIAYTELYDSTKTAAQLIPSKNRFSIKGRYQSSVSSEISLNALNIPEGSVTVLAGGAKLIEGVDYTVDYNLGRVKILNQGILESQTPIKVQLESNTLFGFQSKSLVGAHFNYEVNKDFNIGATVMNLTEKPLTQKVNIGDEPISNTVVGTDISYRTEAPFLTKLVDFLPVISTKEKSNITAYGEFAYLIPGTQRAISREGISYIDGFEGTQSAIDIKQFQTWKLASIPQGQPTLFPEAAIKTGTEAGFDRAHLAWYQVDPSAFYQNTSTTPDHIRDNPEVLENSQMRQLKQNELFPQQQPPQGTLNNIPVLDLAYFPKERGPYNYDTTAADIDADGTFLNPEDRWAGIMRALTTTNFETANIQFIQFWMLDPFNNDATDTLTKNMSGGDLYFNLGNISEDILPDSRKSFENGLPTGTSYDPTDYDTTSWSVVSNEQVIVNAFDNNSSSRYYQDAGLDGLVNEAERSYFSNFLNWVSLSSLNPSAKARLNNDPSSDRYNYYRDDDYDAAELDIVQRYKYFNGTEGNSATPEISDTINADGYPTRGTQAPDIEDINVDNNLSESESYFQYRVSLRPNDMTVGQNFITNEQEIVINEDNGKTEKWYQFKIPIESPESVINGISDFRSIRFMRIFMANFGHEVVLRFARLELIRGEWRKYLYNLNEPGEVIQDDPNSTEFNLAAVNLEENEGKEPVGYVLPPGILREQDNGSINLRQLNEQSLSLEICGLKDGEARAAFKNVTFDVRMYKKLKMFVHGEARGNYNDLQDDQLTCFIRLGTDFEDNYYEFESPIKTTDWAPGAFVDGVSTNADIIWPEANNLEIVFDSLTSLKKFRNKNGLPATVEYSAELAPDDFGVVRRIKIKGNPNLQGMKTIMIGVRNPGKDTDHPWQYAEDGLDKCAEVWVNELRLTDFDQTGGWASTARVNMQLADFGSVNLSGNYSTPNWGSIEKKVSERQRETQMGFDVSSNMELGQFLGKKVNVQVPFYIGYSTAIIQPEFDLLAPDVRLSEYEDPEFRRRRAQESRDVTTRTSYNFTNVRRERPAGKENHLWDIENWSASYSYNELYRRDINTEMDITRTYRGGLNYVYSKKPLLVEPFKNSKFLRKSRWFSLIREFNFYVGPRSLGFNTELARMYNERQNRNALDTNFVFLPTYLKNFTWNRNYDFKYDLSKNIKFSFAANNSSVILEPGGAIDPNAEIGTDEYNNYQLYRSNVRSAFDPFATGDNDFGGFTLNYGHNYDFTYKVPFDKLPLTDFITANVKLRSSYDWQRAPLALPEIGNTVQNSRNFTVNGQLNMVTLYNKIEFLRKINNDGKGGRGGRQMVDRRQQNGADGGRGTGGQGGQEEEEDEEGEEGEDGKKKKKKREGIHPIVKTTGRLFMSFRNLSFTYSQNDGIMLPGFAGETTILGMDNFGAPSFAFASGQQNLDLLGRQTNAWGEYDTYAPFAANNGWLVANPDLNILHTNAHTQSYNGRASFEPFKDLRINVTIDRKYTENENSYFRYNDTLVTAEGIGDWQYQNRVNSGSLSFTTITWKTAFTRLDSTYVSDVFNELRAYRPTVSQQLGEEAGTSLGDDGYYDGFGANQQDVLIGSFLAAYTGQGTGTSFFDVFKALPLPNWDIRYDGLSKMDFMKDYVRNFSISHAYRSNISVSNFQTNLAAFDANGIQQQDVSGNLIPGRQIQSVTITEQFAPFLGVDATWIVGKNGLITKFEFKRDRSLALSVTNLQITEMRGREWVIGSGYKFSKVKLPWKVFGEYPESDLNLRFDLSIRSNIALNRNIIENSQQVTSGQDMYSIKSRVDYNIGKNLNVAIYFDRVVNKPQLSTAFNTANTSAGIALRFNLAQ